MKIELIDIKGEGYAIRKLTLFGYRYLDLSASAVDFWWSRGSVYFINHCLREGSRVAEIYKKYNRKERRLNMNKTIVLGRRRI